MYILLRDHVRFSQVSKYTFTSKFNSTILYMYVAINCSLTP